MSDLVLTRRYPNGLFEVTLNRATALNALNLDMVKQIDAALSTASDDDQIVAVVITSSSDKAFCAGGDVRKICQQVQSDSSVELKLAHEFFELEYALDLNIRNFKKPLITLAQGYVMGGGMGVFCASEFSVACGNVTMAMPEILIGLFTDVGASKFLGNSALSQFAALTGCHLKTAAIKALSLATHQTESSAADILGKLSEFNLGSTEDQARARIDELLMGLEREVRPDPDVDEISSLEFGGDFESCVQTILKLTQHESKWISTSAMNLKFGSPQSAALNWLMQRWAADKTFDEVYALDLINVTAQIQRPDFIEGVRARLIDKDLSAKWQSAMTDPINQILPVLNAFDDQWNDLCLSQGIRLDQS